MDIVNHGTTSKKLKKKRNKKKKCMNNVDRGVKIDSFKKLN